jgi:signal transduction histidine kinase
VSARARILVIDDEPALLSLLGHVLGEHGFETLLAADGAAAVDVARRERPDLVVCDVNMPRLDGYGVLAAVRGEPALAATPFIFLTSDPEARAGMRSGADDYLQKPVSIADLVAACEARLERRHEMAREGERRVEEVRRAIADLLPHELRTPLVGIIGSAEVLRECHATLRAEDVKGLSEAILRGAYRLHRLVENYILFSEFEARRLAGQPVIEPFAAPAGARDVAEAATDVAARVNRAPDLRLELDDVAVPVGSTYLHKAVSELVDNAFRFSEPGSPVAVSLRGPARVVLSVADRGRGLTPAQVKEIAAFRQFDRARYEQQGSGVGLTIARRIVDATGGRVVIESKPGEGTTVRAEWPAPTKKKGG